ncbi:hypothetical protein [Streptomyces sp. NBC_00239]|uniref:hypothetical protein n=1 Tax=Streptomyces sp. NBC_00239 TaxID=2903640 RepID=UPI002E2C85BC|nr:hypothetical protein [Streptomyces sp. NBC_00239]
MFIAPGPPDEGANLLYADESSADELEAVITHRLDVDLEMAQINAEADAWHAVRDRGFCNHGSAIGYRRPPVHEVQKLLKPGELICTAGCDTVFANEEDWHVQTNDPMLNPVPLPDRSTAGDRPARGASGSRV